MEPSIMQKSANKIRLLMIEDYKLIRIGLRLILNDDPAIEVVAEADDGVTGIEAVKKHKPDVVLLDLGLPDINGIEVARTIHRLNPKVRIIILTSHEAEEEVCASMAAGAHAYCTKDAASEQLLQAIKEVQQGALWLDPKLTATNTMDVFIRDMGRLHAYTSVGSEQATLTDKEREVLRFLAEGLSNAEIANMLNVSIHATKTQVCSILQKLKVQDRVQAAVKAVQESLI